MRVGGLLEAAVYGEDLDALERFYVDVLGLELLARHAGRLTSLRCGHAALLLFDPSQTERGGAPVPPHGARGAGHVAFVIPDAELPLWREQLARHDVAIEAELDWPEGGRSLYFRDPAGNSVELAPPAIWGGLGAAQLERDLT
jgi:catechol 2,3-dioxygenase-like lactoylglutathione lyase family enzyme